MGTTDQQRHHHMGGSFNGPCNIETCGIIWMVKP